MTNPEPLRGEASESLKCDVLPPTSKLARRPAPELSSFAAARFDALPLNHPLVVQLREFMAAARSDATAKAYNSDWRDFCEFCLAYGLQALPASPSTVALYIGDQAKKWNRKSATITRRLAAIATIHRKAGHSSPCDMKDPVLSETYQGIRRKKGTKQAGKAAFTLDMLRDVIRTSGDSLRASRDRALFLVGFAGGMRCSELAGMELIHLDPKEEGIAVLLPKSKTDQQGEGQFVALRRGPQPEGTSETELTCPVRALEHWLAAAHITSGPVFRNVTIAGLVGDRLHPNSIRRIVKTALVRAGYGETFARDYAAHSLRAGFITTSHRNGSRESDIMKQTRHKSIDMVRRYIRDEDKAQWLAAGNLGI